MKNIIDLKNPEFGAWLGMQYQYWATAKRADFFNQLSADRRADIERRYKIRFDACAWDECDAVANAVTRLIAAQNTRTAAIDESAYDAEGADELVRNAAHARCEAILHVVLAVGEAWSDGVTGAYELGSGGLTDFATELAAAAEHLTDIAKDRPIGPRVCR